MLGTTNGVRHFKTTQKNKKKEEEEEEDSKKNLGSALIRNAPSSLFDEVLEKETSCLKLEGNSGQTGVLPAGKPCYANF